MATVLPGAALRRHHHITLCTGDAQEDYDFHTKVLGLKSVKKTLLWSDANLPSLLRQRRRHRKFVGNELSNDAHRWRQGTARFGPDHLF